ncbi:uncharacterized protein M6B38_249395 [Iris pallida]|uniref:Peroxidase n=1 Tax=Iris pallida TaxID=29817 RepID=A0AAX6IKH8_IRIPA|nr:uncharacterized protein M6B38_249395 [Iris pallida]
MKFHIFILLIAVLLSIGAEARLYSNYYARSCPNVESIVRDAVVNKQLSAQTTAAGTLRLFFHDCFVGGCDASVLVSSSRFLRAERDADINLSLPGDSFDAVVRAKTNLELACPATVSCADVLALATRDLLTMLGGPFYPSASAAGTPSPPPRLRRRQPPPPQHVGAAADQTLPGQGLPRPRDGRAHRGPHRRLLPLQGVRQPHLQLQQRGADLLRPLHEPEARAGAAERVPEPRQGPDHLRVQRHHDAVQVRQHVLQEPREGPRAAGVGPGADGGPADRGAREGVRRERDRVLQRLRAGDAEAERVRGEDREGGGGQEALRRLQQLQPLNSEFQSKSWDWDSIFFFFLIYFRVVVAMSRYKKLIYISYGWSLVIL